MTDPYTPTTEEVRRDYVRGCFHAPGATPMGSFQGHAVYGARWKSWLAANNAAVREKALEEAAQIAEKSNNGIGWPDEIAAEIRAAVTQTTEGQN